MLSTPPPTPEDELSHPLFQTSKRSRKYQKAIDSPESRERIKEIRELLGLNDAEAIETHERLKHLRITDTAPESVVMNKKCRSVNINA